jgi:nucleoside-diphosphate-sugar epimerase
MKVLILGGTRLSGPYLVRYLVEHGHQVTVFNRGQNPTDLPPSVGRIYGERRKLDDYADEFKRLAPDVVVDMLAYTRGDAEMLRRVFRGAAGRVVVPGSMDVYRAFGRFHGTEPGPPDPIPLTEDSPLREQLSPHGEAYEKRWVEAVVMGDPDLPGTIVRYPMIYGPNDGGRTYDLVKRVLDNRPALVLDERVARWRWSRGFAQNVAWGTFLAVTHDRAAGRIYNIAEPEGLSTLEWSQRVLNVMGWPGEIVVAPPGRMKVEGNYEHHILVDTTRIRAELGYQEMVTLEDALRRTVEWQRTTTPEKIDPADFDYATEDAVLAELGGTSGLGQGNRN